MHEVIRRSFAFLVKTYELIYVGIYKYIYSYIQIYILR